MTYAKKISLVLFGVAALGGACATQGLASEPVAQAPAAAKQSRETAAATVVPAAAPAEARAQITSTEGGDTRVNTGDGYTRATPGMLLKEGDSLFAGVESQIAIYYINEKCTYVINPKTYERVSPVAPCVGAGATPPAATDAAGGGDFDKGLALTAAAAAAAGGVALLLLNTNDDDNNNDRPVSP